MRKWVIHSLQLTVAVALLVVVWRLADGGQALRLLSEADLLWLLAAALVLTLQIVLSARRWQLTASQLGITHSASTAVREYYLSQLPGWLSRWSCCWSLSWPHHRLSFWAQENCRGEWDRWPPSSREVCG